MREQREARPGSRWEIRVTEGSPRGGLFELEVTTRFLVVDRGSGGTVAVFEGLYEASFRDGGWEDATYSGVRSVTIGSDDRHAVVEHADGRTELVPLPCEDPAG